MSMAKVGILLEFVNFKKRIFLPQVNITEGPLVAMIVGIYLVRMLKDSGRTLVPLGMSVMIRLGLKHIFAMNNQKV